MSGIYNLPFENLSHAAYQYDIMQYLDVMISSSIMAGLFSQNPNSPIHARTKITIYKRDGDKKKIHRIYSRNCDPFTE